jgi:D-proline reductase (dithiol) PrdB
MPRLDRLSEAQRTSLLSHESMVNDGAPWTPLAKPLADARLALVTTAALHVRGAAPFTGGHQGYRAIPADTPLANIMLSHTSIGFDRSDVQRDLNVAFPLDRLRELVATGELGSLASTHYAFLGAQRTYDGILNESGPTVARALKADGVEAVLLTGV